MMVVMRHDASPPDVSLVVAFVESHGLRAHVFHGEERIGVSAIGDSRELDREAALGFDGVETVVEISPSYKLASLDWHPEPTRVALGDWPLGPETFSLVAGPCTIEDEDAALRTALDVASAGAHALRGGAYKPRTSPFAFQGLGLEAFPILIEMRRITGLPIVSEILEPDQLPVAADAVDVVQIGARNMQNYSLLRSIGETGKPALLKRGLSATLDELLQAADYLLDAGSSDVILCERGIRTFGTGMRFTLDIGAVVWLKAHTHLPIIVDPSHAAGRAAWVAPLARAAAAVGADGIIVETVEDPTTVRCDRAQQFPSAGLGEWWRDVRAPAVALGRRVDPS